MVFDPYHQWLGIPPAEQPPNHYRLLGIALLESSATVIANAADRQMTHVRTFQSGPHAAHSQQLLNELAAARVTLLTPETKHAYDRQLLAQTAALSLSLPGGVASPPVTVEAGTPIEASTAPPVPPPVTSSAVASETASPRLGSRHSSRRDRKKGWELAKIVAGGVAGIAISLVFLKAIGFFGVSGTGKRNNSEIASAPDASSGAKQDATPRQGEKDIPSPVSGPRPEQPVSEEPAKADNKAENSPQPVPETPSTASQPAPDAAKLDGDDATSESSNSPELHAALLRSIPPPAAQRDALIAEVDRLYKPQALKTAQERVAAAGSMLAAAREGSDADERLALLLSSAEWSRRGGDLSAALATADLIASQYELDGWSFKADLVGRYADSANTDDDRKVLIAQAKALIYQSLATERFDLAHRLAEATHAACRDSRDPALRQFVLDGRSWINRLSKQFSEFQEAQQVLTTSPADTMANATVGRWLCLYRDDWTLGPSHLALAADELLKEVSAIESKNPDDAESCANAGDTWMKAARGDLAGSSLARARHWFGKAKSMQPGALLLARLDQQLAKIDADKSYREWGDLARATEVARRLMGRRWTVAWKNDSVTYYHLVLRSDGHWELEHSVTGRASSWIGGAWDVDVDKGAVAVVYPGKNKELYFLRDGAIVSEHMLADGRLVNEGTLRPETLIATPTSPLASVPDSNSLPPRLVQNSWSVRWNDGPATYARLRFHESGKWQAIAWQSGIGRTPIGGLWTFDQDSGQVIALHTDLKRDVLTADADSIKIEHFSPHHSNTGIVTAE
ncbi:MAG TPA: hypothetical protein VMP01_07825 [Pirellulaceae bacterium]|nr:hypothetical protein [Pirellulaceae bacterium]